MHDSSVLPSHVRLSDQIPGGHPPVAIDVSSDETIGVRLVRFSLCRLRQMTGRALDGHSRRLEREDAFILVLLGGMPHGASPGRPPDPRRLQRVSVSALGPGLFTNPTHGFRQAGWGHLDSSGPSSVSTRPDNSQD